MFSFVLFCAINIAVPAVICTEIVADYPISIGAGTIVDPAARISAVAGPINIGQGNIIKASAVIANSLSRGTETPVFGSGMFIANGNIFDPGSTCKSLKVGNGNIFKSGSLVGRRVTLTNGCIITEGCVITREQTVPEGTIVSGNRCDGGHISDEEAYVREREPEVAII